MTTPRACLKCGAVSPGDALDGLCPSCVLSAVIDQSPEVEEIGRGLAPERPFAAGGERRFLGNYELLFEIGRGGMGAVYRARQSGLNRLVAVKVILGGHFASRDSVQRFLNEARAAARLQHPNIVALHEVGEHEGQHYYSMDLVEGVGLDTLVRERPLSPGRAATYVRFMSEAIQHAHERGVLHRDLKPSNVLVDEHDQPRITDFGLAKELAGDGGVTLTGQVLGSPTYMPPEQAGGPGTIGPWSDVYALGAILYQLLTGRGPFLADTIEKTIRQVLDDSPVSPRAFNPQLPRDLETICLKCLQKDPARRYRSAGDLAAELGRFLRGEPIQARPVHAVEKAWHWCRRRPAIAGLLGTVVFLLVALVVGSITAAVRIQGAQRLATEKLRQSYLDQARARRVSGRVGQRFDSLNALSNAAALNPPAELQLQLRNEAIACLALIDSRPGRVFPLAPTPSVEHFRFTPDLEHFVRIDELGRLRVRRTADGTDVSLRTWRKGRLYWVHAFSPDGRWLAIESGPGTLTIADVRTRDFHYDLRIGHSACDFSPDGTRFVASRTNGAVAVYDVATGQLRKEIPGGFAEGFVRFSPDGLRLAWYNRVRRHVEIREIESGLAVRTLSEAAGAGTKVAVDLSWSPDAKRLAVAQVDGRGAIWDLDTGEKRFALDGHDNSMVRIQFSRSGRFVATTSWDDTTRIWDSFNGHSILRVPGMSYQLTFSEDDRRLAFVRAGDRVQVLDLAVPSEVVTLAPSTPSTGPFEPAFSADGRWLANACSAGVQLWEVASGRALGFVPEPKCRSTRFAVDGKYLFTSGQRGLGRWALNRSETNSALVRLDPRVRETLPVPRPLMQMGLSADGETLAVVNRSGNCAMLQGTTNGSKPLVIGIHDNVQFVALSPDSRWLATAAWSGTEVKIWETHSRRLARQIPAGPNATVEFSPNGEWLVTAGTDYRLWKVGTWEAGPVVALPQKNVPVGYAAFSADSRMLAVVHAGRELHLVEASTARLLAVLEPPTPVVLSFPKFSSDGTHLAAAGSSGEVFLWNIPQIRRHLAKMRLDWGESATGASVK